MASKKGSLLAKALAAAAAANQLLGASPAALCQPQVHAKTTEQIIQIIETDETLQSAQRAYLLMQLANCLLNKEGLESFKAWFDNNRRYKYLYLSYRTFERAFNLFVSRLVDQSDIDFALQRRSPKMTRKPHAAIDKVELEQARMAVSDSLKDIEKIVDPVTRNKMLFIAFHLLNQAGEYKEAIQCRDLVINEIVRIEGRETAQESETNAAAAILDLIALKIIPIEIPDFLEQPTEDVSRYSTLQRSEAERIKLRALRLLDRLPAATHSRRKAHRDMALYYLKFNEAAKSAEQKELLCELVGWHSDKILFPQVGSCGRAIWWLKEPPKVSFMCGMG